MEPVTAPLAFLSRLPLYTYQKPYIVIPPKGSGEKPAEQRRLENLEFSQVPVIINDMRMRKESSLSVNGFQKFDHPFGPFDLDEASVLAYRGQTESILREILDAEAYRRNSPLEVLELDVNDPLLVEGPPTGVHDLTYDHAPKILRTLLKEHGKAQYLKPGSRIRVVNTWRPMVSKLEDRPLAFCDFRTVDPNDAIPTDRVYPHRSTELYYFHHNENQRWYWLPGQTPDETLMMLMYDTHPDGGAEYCPHVSFPNPLAAADAPPRESVETRSIVITRASVA
ncbi:hypothetical protein LTR84_004060 [Exophiala bonariae]|uniref:Methyltransferase n=1 Tax=Exophiala bonariae TaxID=1690606 RepID=A0AAV9N8P1_9EURO|nr:hypothetical protein LTR84_004060 [Exophiala bonariae]